MLRHLTFRSVFPIIQRSFRAASNKPSDMVSSRGGEAQDRRRNRISVVDFMNDPYADDSLPTDLPKYSRRYAEFDVLRDAIKKSYSIMEILTIVRLNKDTMEAPQINTAVSCLTRLRHAEKQMDTARKDEEILTLEEFQLMCKIIVQRIRSLSTQHLISCLLFVDTFNISIKTTVSQAILQLIRQRINDFEVNQVCFLHATLERIKESQDIEDGLLNAVIMALPTVFEIKVANNLLDFTNTTTVVSCIRFAVHHKLRPETVNKLMDAAEANKNSLNSYECFHLRESLNENKIGQMDIKRDIVNSLLQSVEEKAKAWEFKRAKEMIP